MELWRTLEAQLQHPRLTSSATWIETWLTHYGSLIPHEFVIARRAEDVIGLCLVTESVQRFGPLSIRKLHIGTAGEPEADSVCVEFNSLLVGPQDHAEFAAEIQHCLEQRSAEAVAWDGFDAAELPSGADGNRKWHVDARETFFFDLRTVRTNALEPIAQLGRTTRKQIQRNLRGLSTLNVEWSETPRQIDEIYDELVALHQSRWQAAGKPGSFASEIFREFHLDLLHRLVPLDKAAVVRVRAGRRTIGCTLLHIEQNRALVYQSGWGEDSAKSPGVVNDYCCLVECLRRGYDAYDFMAGDSTHKRRMTTHQSELVWATCRRSMWKFGLIDQFRSAKRRWQAWTWTGKGAT